MNEHTPGPWLIHPKYKSVIAVPLEGNDGALRILAHVERVNPAQWPANARLMAAALDMFAALKEVAKWVEIRPATHPFDTWQAVRAAIAKVEGRS